MEEILASIRRILNEDDPAAQPDEPAADEDDVLVLDRSMMVAQPEPEAAEAPPAPAPRPTVMEAPTPPPNDMDDLVAPSTAAAAASSLGNLARSLSSASARPTQVWAGGPTLEDIVRSELRPLLKDWLDTNLPPMVERMVKAEIARVAGNSGF
jgi:cell pole-organizing protein PopZ